MKKIAKELRQKTKKELLKEIDSLRMEIAKSTLGAKANPVKDTNLIFKNKKKLAVALTVLKEKQE